MSFTEPTTAITDYLLTLASAIFAIRTFRLRSSHRARVLWILTFACAALAALIGGTFHGFKLNFTAGVAKSLWDTTNLLLGGTVGFLISATIVSSLRPANLEYVRWLKRGLLVSAVGLGIQKIGWNIHPDFNHNDIYHLIQIVGFWFLFEGVRRMK